MLLEILKILLVYLIGLFFGMAYQLSKSQKKGSP